MRRERAQGSVWPMRCGRSGVSPGANTAGPCPPSLSQMWQGGGLQCSSTVRRECANSEPSLSADAAAASAAAAVRSVAAPARTCSRKRAADNVQQATSNGQHALDTVKRRACSGKRAVGNDQMIGSVSRRRRRCARKAGRRRDRTSSSCLASTGTCAAPYHTDPPKGVRARVRARAKTTTCSRRHAAEDTRSAS